MLAWLKRRKNKKELPEYAGVRSIPNRGLPTELTREEQSASFSTVSEGIQRSLIQPPQRPEDDSPLFVTLLGVDDDGPITLSVPEGDGPCLLAFSSPVRAADYVQTLLASGPRVRYLSSSPREFIGMLRDVSAMGAQRLALDRCPRCDIITVVGTEEARTPEDAISFWSVIKSLELARLNLYLDYASSAARDGQTILAREVAFETVAHVSLEDPRPHFLLGQLAIALSNPRLLREAKTYLQFLHQDTWERRLDEAVVAGTPDFDLSAPID